MAFDLCVPNRVIFGLGVSAQIDEVMAGVGKRPFVVTGADPLRHGAVVGGVLARGVQGSVCGEPDFERVRELVNQGREAECDSVLAIGGGSVIDAGKAVAMLMANGGDPLDYAEVIGQGKPVRVPALPCVAVPTTAGAGSEATRNAVLRSREHGVKVSLRSNRMMPVVALVDPQLTCGLAPAITAATGLDALSQVMEPFVSSRANEFTEVLCREGLLRIARSLLQVFTNGNDLEARADMSLGALYGGMALANAGLGAVHGFAAPIGGMFDAPHGAVCAALLAPVMEANVRMGGEKVRARYSEVARIVCVDTHAEAEAGVRWVRDLTRALGIPGLRAYGVREDDVETLCERASAASSMRGNPVVLDRETLRVVLLSAL
jgi:alcohol dehydrogenase class IV